MEKKDLTLVYTVMLPMLIITFLLSLFSIAYIRDINKKIEDLDKQNKAIIDMMHYNLREIRETKNLAAENSKQIKSINKQISTINNRTKELEDTLKEKTDKIVYLIKSVNKNLDDDTARLIAINIIKASIRYNVPIEYIIAVMWTESTFNPSAYNENTDCIGLMQINYNVWANHNIPKFMLFDIHVNIDAGVRILRYYYDKYHNWDDAIIAYYGISKYAKYKYKPRVKRKIRIVTSML